MARILLIEDVGVVRMVVRKMLERAGHSVVEAQGGRDGLDRLAAGGFDLVITDIWMPDGDGISFIRTAKARMPEMKVLAFSGGAPRASMDHTLREAQACGADGVLMKPVDRRELDQALAELLGGGDATGDGRAG